MEPLAPRQLVNREPDLKWKKIAGGGLFLAVGGVALIPFDRQIANWIDADRLSGDPRRFFELTEFFAHGIGITLILVSVFVLSPENRRRIGRVTIALLLTSGTVQLLKHLIWRIRPGHLGDSVFSQEPNSWLGPYWMNESLVAQLDGSYVIHSFPSGHSAAVVALAVGLIWLLGRGKGLFVGMAVLGCLQRILFHAHWPSDVLIGASIGFLIASVICFSRLGDWAFSKFEMNR